MDSSGLRVGNFVYDEKNNIVEIDSIYNKSMVTFEQIDGNYIVARFPVKDLKPIPLTEEWLIKFGFSVREGGYAHLNLHNKGAYIYINHSGSGIAIENDETELSYQIELKYVHQLQNLFYALTKTEL